LRITPTLGTITVQATEKKIMLVTHGNHEFSVDMARTDSVEWVVSECTSRLHTSPSPGTFYWCVFIKYQSPEGVFREFVLESGLLYDKVRAFTQARKRARHFRRERYNEMEANKGPIIPNMKGWK
jgi:hypothetical protein